MSSLNYMELCRLCLVKDRVQIPIFEGEGDIRQIFLKIAACLPVKVKKDDKLPKKICDDCMYKVEMLYQFWNTTANAEKQLLEWLGEAVEEKKTESHVKTENLEQDPCSELAKSLSRVEAVLAEAREAESDNDNFASGKPETDSDDEPLSSLEPSTFVNVGLDASGATEPQTQGQFLAPGAPSTSKSINSTNAQAASGRTSLTSYASPNNLKSSSYEKSTSIINLINVKTKFKDYNSKYKVIIKNETSENESFTIKKNASLKIRSDVENVKKFQCDQCEETTSTSKLLKKHKLKCHGGNFLCEFCKKIYNSKYLLKQHLNKVHPPNALDLKCDLCDYRTHNRFNLKSHIDRHNKAASFICDECGKGFYSNGTLEEHKKGKHGTGFPCELCGTSLTSMSNLRQHRKTHEPKTSGVKYQCDICGQGYQARSKCAFRLHVLKHQGIVKQFKCSDCNKILTSGNSYRQHLRKHSGEKPFICEFCSKAFSENKYLQVHRRIHTGEKPYECDICGACFNQRSTMTSHRKSHGKLTFTSAS